MPSTLPPCSTARSTIPAPGFIALTVSSLMSLGAGLPGISAVVITTALIPGRPAPRLIKEETVKAMKPGAGIVDLAVEQGGNVEGIERGRTVVKHGVKLIGQENLAATVATDASALYARNLYNFLVLMLDPKSGEFKLDRADEIIAGTLACTQGEVLKKAD